MPRCMCREQIRPLHPQHVASAVPIANSRTAFAANSAVPATAAATVHAMRDAVHPVHAVLAIPVASSNRSNANVQNVLD